MTSPLADEERKGLEASSRERRDAYQRDLDAALERYDRALGEGMAAPWWAVLVMALMAGLAVDLVFLGRASVAAGSGPFLPLTRAVAGVLVAGAFLTLTGKCRGRRLSAVGARWFVAGAAGLAAGWVAGMAVSAGFLWSPIAVAVVLFWVLLKAHVLGPGRVASSDKRCAPNESAGTNGQDVGRARD